VFVWWKYQRNIDHRAEAGECTSRVCLHGKQ